MAQTLDPKTERGDRVAALLLAGGLGTRLKPITDTTPKCLVPVMGRPMLDYWMEAMIDVGVERARVNTHHLPDAVRSYIADRNRDGRIDLAESYEPVLLGSAGTVTANRDLAEDVDDVLLIYADNLSSVDLGDMVRFHRSHGDPMTMLLFRAENPSACGIAELDDDGRVIGFEEKPTEPKSDLANAGVYVVTADAYREIADLEGFDLGFDVLPRFVGRMRGYSFDGYHRDIGTLEALAAAESEAPEFFAKRESQA